MKRIRMRVILLACWLAVFFGLGQLPEPVFTGGATKALVFVAMIIVLLTPRFTRLPLPVFLVVSLVILAVLRAWTWVSTGSFSLSLTITEASAIVVTVLLAYWVSMAISEFENAVVNITIGQRNRVPEPVSVGQGSLYREVRRARNHQRPLALMAISVEEKSIKVALDRMVQETQMSLMRQYTLSSVSKLLCDKLEDCDLIVQGNNHFLVALPETTPENLPGLIERLRQQVSDQVGVDLRIGTASLPQDGYTFEGLLDKATQYMRGDLESEPFMELERLFVERHIT